MPNKWTVAEEKHQRKLLTTLYVSRNLTIGQIAHKLKISESGVFDRLQRLGIKTTKHLKLSFKNKRKLNTISYSNKLAEFIGVMCGDGHLSDGQVIVNLGSKERAYAKYIQSLFKKLFKVELKACERKDGYIDLYIGFVELVRSLKSMGLASNKVKAQIGAPSWIFKTDDFKRNFLRGLFDTDGSVYKLKFGWQISFCNRSLRLLKDSRRMLISLGFGPSQISGYNFYVTKRRDLAKFIREIDSFNTAKAKRFKAMGGWVSS